MAHGLREPASPRVRAIEASHLRSLPPRALAELTADAIPLRVPAGSTLHREGESEPHVRLVVTGLVRVYVSAADGRTLTVRYCRPGALLGVVSLFASPFALPASIQAVSDVELLALRPSRVRQSADRDVRVARALLDELGERVQAFIAEIPGGAFASVRQRVARHLLDLASAGRDGPGPGLAAAVTQQELAEAVGTVREVVVRTLRELRAEGLVQTRRDRIVLLDPERLAEDGAPEGRGRAPLEWNKGP